MPPLSMSYLQRLQRLYSHFRQNFKTLLGGLCSTIELIDDDDLTNWFVQLRYEDENKQEFIICLRVFFIEELQRMPLVFVVSPRLFATFIHHGAICSLEFMSQQWTVDVEGLCLLLHCLHTTLNPFGCSSRVTVDEPRRWAAGNDAGGGATGLSRGSAASFYTSEEHDLGIQHIRDSHPHLFRSKVRGQKPACDASRQTNTSKLSGGPGAPSDGEQSDPAFGVCASGQAKGMTMTVSRATYCCEQLRQMRFTSQVMDIFLNSSQQKSTSLRPPHKGTNAMLADSDMAICNLPASHDGGDVGKLCFNISIAPMCESRVKSEDVCLPTGACVASTVVNSAIQCDQGCCSACCYPLKEESGLKTPCATDACAAKVGTSGNNGSPGGTEEARDSTVGSNRDGCCGGTTCVYPLIRVALCGSHGGEVDPCAASDGRPGIIGPCVVPPGCTLRLRHLEVHAGAITVLGTLEMDSCVFKGNIATEAMGRVILSRSRVFVDVGEGRREGILVLDESRLDLCDGTIVERYVPAHGEVQESVSAGAVSPSVLHSFIYVSNSARLFARGNCRIAPHRCERVVLAEQDALLNVSDCDIECGYITAVSVAGCRAFFSGTRFYGDSQVVLQASDSNRPTGLNVELGGLVTARHCLAEHVYFGFSVISHSVAHFCGCHAEHVVNGYTVDASRATFESSSAFTNHVGIFALKGAKCTIDNEAGSIAPFEERCRAVLATLERGGNSRRVPLAEAGETTEFNGGDETLTTEGTGKLGNGFHAGHGLSSMHESGTLAIRNGTEKENEYVSAAATGFSARGLMHDVEGGRSNMDGGCGHGYFPDRLCNKSVLLLSIAGGLFGLEVREASVVARGLVLKDAGASSICVYDQGHVELTNTIVMSSLPASYQTCAVKIVDSTAALSRCLATGHSFGFTASQGSDVVCEECVGVCGFNSFIVDGSVCKLHSCGAYSDDVGVLAINQSTLRMDNSAAPDNVLCGIPCVLQCRVSGVDNRSSHVRCVRVTVRGAHGSGFACYSGGYLSLKECVVEASHDISPGHEARAGALSDLPSAHQLTDSASRSPVDKCSVVGIDSGANNEDCGGCAGSHKGTVPASPSLCTVTGSLGVKAWAGGRCELVACEVRCATFGYAALDADTEMEVWRCSAYDVVNGYMVDCAKCCLSDCTADAKCDGVLVLNQGTCIVDNGNYRAKERGIESRGGIVQAEGNVKVSNFRHSGIYVCDGGRFDTTVDSLLKVKAREDFVFHQPADPSGSLASQSGRCDLLPCCFLMDQGTAIIHGATFGYGVMTAVGCGEGANLFLYRCRVEFCSVAFNVLTGSNVYLSDCVVQNAWNRSLLVHRGGVIRVTSSQAASHPLDVVGACSAVQGNVEVSGRCALDNSIVHLSYTTGRGANGAPSPLESQGELRQVESPILVYEGGQLSMDSCHTFVKEMRRAQLVDVKVEEGGPIHDYSEVKVIICARGMNASVQLHNALFRLASTSCPHDEVASFPLYSPRSRTPCDTRAFQSDRLKRRSDSAIWYALGLHGGAKGEVHGPNDVDPRVRSESAAFLSPFGTSGRAGQLEGLFPFEASERESAVEIRLHDSPCPTVPAVNDGIVSEPSGDCLSQGVSSRQLPKLQEERHMKTLILPLRLHVTGGSSLIIRNERVRRLSAAMDSDVSASRCTFAGSGAVFVGRGSSLRALQSVFLSGVGGPALQAEHANVLLRECTGYCIHREAIVAKHATVTLEDCVVRTSSTTTLPHGGVWRLGTSHQREAQATRTGIGVGGCGKDRGPCEPSLTQGLYSRPFLSDTDGCDHSTKVGNDVDFADTSQERDAGLAVEGWSSVEHEGRWSDVNDSFSPSYMLKLVGSVDHCSEDHRVHDGVGPSPHVAPALTCRQRVAVRLEDSYLHHCLFTYVEGTVAADSASETNIIQRPQPWHTVYLLRDALVSFFTNVLNKLPKAAKHPPSSLYQT